MQMPLNHGHVVEGEEKKVINKSIKLFHLTIFI